MSTSVRFCLNQILKAETNLHSAVKLALTAPSVGLFLYEYPFRPKTEMPRASTFLEATRLLGITPSCRQPTHYDSRNRAIPSEDRGRTLVCNRSGGEVNHSSATVGCSPDFID